MNKHCAVPNYIHTPHPPRRALLIYTPTPLEWCLPNPATPGFSVISLLGWVPAGKNVSLKNGVALYFYAKDNCFYEKRKHLYLC